MATSLRIRLLLGAAIWIGLALVGAGIGISWLLREHLRHNFDNRLDAFAFGLMAVVEIDPASGDVRLSRTPVEPNFERVGSGWLWQMSDASGVRLRSRSLWNEELALDAPAQAGHKRFIEQSGPGATPLRILVADITAPGGTDVLRIAVAGPQSEIYENLQRIERPLIVALLLLGAGLSVAVLIQTTVGLRPFGQLREHLAEIRQGRRERLPERTLSEVAPLIAEVNSLLDHNATVIQRARTHAANLAHALKTPLSALSAAAAQPDRVSDATIRETVSAIDRLIQHHLRRARAAGSSGLPGVRIPVGPAVEEMLGIMSKIHAERGIKALSHIDAEAVFLGERQDLEEMLGNILDNAFKWARSTVEVSVLGSDERLSVTVADDGPGLDSSDHEAALNPGTRLDSAVPGHGFGLSIVRDLAQLYGGTLALGRGPSGGLEVRLTI
jgi:signal transduction histidine kinase